MTSFEDEPLEEVDEEDEDDVIEEAQEGTVAIMISIE